MRNTHSRLHFLLFRTDQNQFSLWGDDEAYREGSKAESLTDECVRSLCWVCLNVHGWLTRGSVNNTVDLNGRGVCTISVISSRNVLVLVTMSRFDPPPTRSVQLICSPTLYNRIAGWLLDKIIELLNSIWTAGGGRGGRRVNEALVSHATVKSSHHFCSFRKRGHAEYVVNGLQLCNVTQHVS